MLPGQRSVVLAVLAILLTAVAGSAQPIVGQVNGQDIHREFGYIPLKDGVKLSYVVYRPAEGRHPVLLEFSPYNVDASELDRQDGQTSVREYLEHGYAYAGVAIRGTSCSQGKLSMFDPVIGEDGAQVVDWVGSQTWSTGSVGMIGISYAGHTQIFTAAKRPKYLKAITPYALTASSYREAWRPGGLFNVNFIGGWAFSTTRGLGALGRKKWGDDQCDVERAGRAFENTFYEILQHPLHDEWWKARDLENHIGQIQVPVLMNQAWQDHETQISAAIRLFRELNAPNKRIILQTGGHFVGRRSISKTETFRWMDRWLKGEDNGADKESPITIWWEVHEAGGKLIPAWTTTHPSWPVPGVRSEMYYLTAGGQLSREMPPSSKDNGARSYMYHIGTELPGDNEQFALPPNPTGVLAYRTPPMTEDVTILGYPQLTFYLSSEQKDTDVMVSLHDVDEKGDTIYLQRDFLRASLRSIDSKRSLPDEVLRSFDKVEPLKAGEIYEMKLSIPPLGHVLRRGHSLELSIMAPPTIGPPGHWGFTILELPGRNTVYHSPQYPSSLVLPVLPGVKAQAPAPPCGSIEFQPCRKAARSEGRTPVGPLR